MTVWHWLGVAGLALAAIPLLYGLHRLALWLEARGLLYYKHKKPTSSAAGCFTALQQFIEPGMKHVIEVKNDRTERQKEEEDEKERLSE